jgi:hypothetical protein
MGALIAPVRGGMSDQRIRPMPDEIRSLLERVDGQLREAERLRNFANEQSRRTDYYPDRRKTPRVPTRAESDLSDDHVCPASSIESHGKQSASAGAALHRTRVPPL